MMLKKLLGATPGGLALTLLLACSAPSAHANVYATNIKLNGGTTNLVTTQGAGINISYILNETASAGVAVNVFSGTNILRAISLASGSPGALRGTNTVFWDTRDNGGTEVTQGVYSVSVTATSKGYTNWTQISPDTTNYYVSAPTCIAVNLNTNSPFYGRVLVGNANGPNNAPVPGDNDGIIKCNADGSFADEGAYSAAGYAWNNDQALYACPQKLRIGGDDRVYALDANQNGVVVACDMIMSSNQVVFDEPNYHDILGDLRYGWGAMDITDAGTTNGLVWMGDVSPNNGLGIRTWRLTNGVADPNDHAGTVAVSAGGGSDLQSPSGGFMVDGNTNIFVSQKLQSGYGGSKALRFNNWDGTNALSSAAWNIATADNTSFIRWDFDAALDSRLNPRYVACGMDGSLGIRLLNPTNGSLVTNINSGVSYHATAWDNVGNLYAVADALKKWRVFSPPGGTNQATTTALNTVQVNAAQTPQIASFTSSNGLFVILFTGSPSDSPSSFSLRNATVVSGPYWDAEDATITQVSPGLFRATVPIRFAAAFFRILRHGSAPLPPPQITDISDSGGIITIHFTGLVGDLPSAFVTLVAPTADGAYASAANAVTTALGPGYFQVTLPETGQAQFYKVVR